MGGTHGIPWVGPWDPRVGPWGPIGPWGPGPLGTHGPWGPGPVPVPPVRFERPVPPVPVPFGSGYSVPYSNRSFHATATGRTKYRFYFLAFCLFFVIVMWLIITLVNLINHVS